MPLISVIIAVYNNKSTLQQCLDSVVRQTYSNVELIVIDGNSSDGTVELLKENSQEITFFISEPDTGIYNAWNKGLNRAKGDWICFLGADDFLLNNQVFENISKKLALIPSNVCVAYSQIMLVNHSGEKLYPIGESWENVGQRFKQVMCIPHPAVMHRRDLFARHGYFDESFKIAGDYELLLRELKTESAIFIPGIISTAMRQGGVSTNPANTLLGLHEVRVAQRKNGKNWPGVFWLMAFMRAYIRSILWILLGEKTTRKILDVARRLMGLPVYWTKT
jgi:glycosyltransferase involved in cell wall biosynthesis